MSSYSSFMAGPGPAIHETAVRTLVGNRAKPGHERYWMANKLLGLV